MLIKNILIVTVFLSSQTHDLVRAEKVRGVEIQDLNVTGIFGDWFVLAGPPKEIGTTCTIMSFSPQSKDTFEMNITYVVPLEVVDMSATSIYDCSIDELSNIMTCHEDQQDQHFISVVLDVEYDSYMVMYAADKAEKLYSGVNGVALIVGREKTVPDGLFEEVKQSIWVKKGMKPTQSLQLMRISGCP